MKKDRIGRYLCLILRHKPETIGIQLDRNGWARVDELLSGVRAFRETYTAAAEEAALLLQRG